MFAPATALADAEPSFDDPSSLPRGTFVRVPPTPKAFDSDRDPFAGGSPHIIYLNRCAGGITLTSGWPDDNQANRSGILNGTTNFAPFSYGDDAWNQVVAETTEIFSPFNILITDVDPSPMPHDEAIVCGSGSAAGFGGAGGVAPFTCDIIPDSISFTFPQSLGGNPRVIAEVVAQEVAHAWGLEHSYNCEDPMTYLSGCGEKTYQDGDFPCGEFSARACECGGTTQNTFQYILDLFGSAVPDMASPTVSITSPTDGQMFDPGASFVINATASDDVAVSGVQLFANGEAQNEVGGEPYDWDVANIPEGDYDFYVVAQDAAGNSTVSDTITIHVGTEEIPDDSGVTASGGDEGDSDGNGDEGGGEGGGSDSGDEDEDADDDSDDDDFAETDDGALPPGFGNDGAGCACATDPSNGAGWGWMLFLIPVARIWPRRTRMH